MVRYRGIGSCGPMPPIWKSKVHAKIILTNFLKIYKKNHICCIKLPQISLKGHKKSKLIGKIIINFPDTDTNFSRLCHLHLLNNKSFCGHLCEKMMKFVDDLLQVMRMNLAEWKKFLLQFGLGGRSQITSQKTTFSTPLFPKKEKFCAWTVTNSPTPSPKRDVICERPLRDHSLMTSIENRIFRPLLLLSKLKNSFVGIVTKSQIPPILH